LDTVLHGAFYTYDAIWEPGWTALSVVAPLVVLQWVLLPAALLWRRQTQGDAPALPPWALLGIGPFLFLQVVVFQNSARLAALTGWPLDFASGWTLLAQVAGLCAAALLLRRSRALPSSLGLGAGLLLLAATSVSGFLAGWHSAYALLVGQVLLAVILVELLSGRSNRSEQAGLAAGMGMLLFMGLLAGYYAGYYYPLGYPNNILEPVAAVFIAVCAFGAARSIEGVESLTRRALIPAALGVCLLAVPLAGALAWEAPQAEAGSGFPVTVMTYNLHNGFNTEGRLDLESLASVIEDSGADIVALQEVSRGWLISGRTDMLSWLSRRLDMPYVSCPTAGLLWGNAILSRYPVLGYSLHEFPVDGLAVRRGVAMALIDLGHGYHLRLMATHFHHMVADSHIRLVQTGDIIGLWSGSKRTVFLGDLNAEPEHREMALLWQAGLLDAFAEVETPPYTWPSREPHRRIDYIWVSPDLAVIETSVPFSTASDHLPVIAVIELAR
ncbi:MAG: endonuclease/exonuclease/phosphatase family protein, partial [Dehalococcoidia bacterium]|nr:endonuclease/exonuclease/phosphatase family protein [Dehalococcoidia bacterium]